MLEMNPFQLIDQFLSFDFGQFNNTMVLNNDVVFGAVNANRRHYEIAAAA